MNTIFQINLENVERQYRINVIKGVRYITGLGLKEAKDLVVDEDNNTNLLFEIERGPYVTDDHLKEGILLIKQSEGQVINITKELREEALENIKTMAVELLEKEDYELSGALIDILARF